MKYIRCVDDLLATIEYAPLPRDCLYRGQSNASWKIAPSIIRSQGTLSPYLEVKNRELACYEPLIRGKRPPLARSYHPLEYLTYIQHYQIPTRLLDWSRDILIGLFFSCWDDLNVNVNEHGKLFILLIENDEIETVDIFRTKSNLEFQKFDIKRIQEEMTAIMQSRKITMIDPMIRNPRMRIQNGVFINCPLFTDDEGVCLSFGKIMNKLYPKRLLNQIIHKDYKKDILTELDIHYGINSHTLLLNNSFADVITKEVNTSYLEGVDRINRLFNTNLSGTG
jgi:hypothetical protein